MLEKYEFQYPLQNLESKEKTKKSNILKYGCENPMSNDEVKNKMIKTKQILGIYLQDSDRDDFINYKFFTIVFFANCSIKKYFGKSSRY